MVKKLLNNRSIANNIRIAGRKLGLGSDTEICNKVGIHRQTLQNMAKPSPTMKNSPRLDTIHKLTCAVEEDIENIIYNPAQQKAGKELALLFSELTSAEQDEVKQIVSGMILRQKYGTGTENGSGEKRAIRKLKAA
jgi:DNA-binding XRE family transcriptional regulator